MFFRRLWIACLILLILVTVACVIFVYLVSPLRDPAFQAEGDNAGTPVLWLKDVKENDWTGAGLLLAGLLALNSMLVLWTQEIVTQISTLIMLGLGMWSLLHYVFLVYLLAQWLVD